MSIEIINNTDFNSLEPLFNRYDFKDHYTDALEVVTEAWDLMNNLSQEITTDLDEERISEIEEEFHIAKSDWESNCHILHSEDEFIQNAVIARLEAAIEFMKD